MKQDTLEGKAAVFFHNLHSSGSDFYYYFEWSWGNKK